MLSLPSASEGRGKHQEKLGSIESETNVFTESFSYSLIQPDSVADPNELVEAGQHQGRVDNTMITLTKTVVSLD